jgi:threonine/homoserine/homoserine lactone efflux protein
MSLSQIGGFALAAFVIIVVPGPSVLFVVSRGVALGRRAAVATVVGNTLGALVLAWLVAFGLGELITASVAVFTLVKLAGAAYLVWLGLRMWRQRDALGDAVVTAMAPRSVGRIVREGFVVGVTNPKLVVFFAAVLPQFVDRDASLGMPAQMAVLGLVFAAVALVSDGTWGMLAGTARGWLARQPGRLRRVGGFGGLVVVALGLRLAVTGRHD